MSRTDEEQRMTVRGRATRARLIEATVSVVREVGYAHASTRAIAEAAGVAEGTIYRHFPDKASLFFAALLESNAPVVALVTGLPARAGEGTVEANLVEAAVQLAGLRDQIMPLELAMAADPELAAQRRRAMAAAGTSLPPGPPAAVAAYLTAEQRLGRIRADLDPREAAGVLLGMLFALGTTPGLADEGPNPARVASAVRMLVRGIEPPPSG
jgi:AcrR family transcriptional regulator